MMVCLLVRRMPWFDYLGQMYPTSAADQLQDKGHIFCLLLGFMSCGAGSRVPREGFDSSVIMPFSWCVVAVTLSK